MFMLITLLISHIFAESARKEGPEFFVPFQILRPNPEHDSLEAAADLSKLLDYGLSNKKIAIVGVVGPFHSGKSFLLNTMIGRTNVFSVGPKTSPETAGIWLCRTDRKNNKGEEIWLLDSEGFFGPQVAAEYDARVFTVSALLSSELLYNSVKVIDQSAVNMLETLTRQAQLFSVKTAGSLGQHDIPTFLRPENLPQLNWIVEDFVQEKSDAPPESWIRSFLSTKGDSFLMHAFPDLSVKTLFLPSTNKNDLTDLSKVSWSELTDEFRSDVESLRSDIFGRVAGKYGLQTPKDVFVAINFIVSGLNKGNFPDLPSLWVTWKSQLTESSTGDAFAVFDAALHDQVDALVNPVTLSEFNNIAATARQTAGSFYNALMHMFTTQNNQKLTELDTRMKERFSKSCSMLSEKIRIHLDGRLSDSVHKMQHELSSVTSSKLPMELEKLRTLSSSIVNKFMTDFVALQKKFYGDGHEEGLNSMFTCRIPSNFTLADSLRKEGNDSAESLAKENQSRITSILKAASLESQKALDELCSLHQNELMGHSQLNEFLVRGLRDAVHAFEANVESKMSWSKSSDIFHQTKKLLEIDVHSRLSRFRAAQEQKANDWFKKLGDRLLGEFREMKRQTEVTALPSEEAALADNHERIKMQSIQKLDDLSGSLSDLQVYHETKSRLENAMKVEWERLRKKNIELWKVHSDEATQCAIEMNKAYRSKNCVSGWMCMFAILPAVHKRISFQYLNECFDRGSRMPESMRSAVFQSWYEKELAPESNEVFKNLIVTLAAMLLPIALGVYNWLNRGVPVTRFR